MAFGSFAQRKISLFSSLIAWPYALYCATRYLHDIHAAYDLMDAAVSNTGEALDLAAALIKLSRLSPVEPPADLTAALVHSPGAVMNARVERLIAWSEERVVPPGGFSAWYGLGAALATVAISALTYGQLLVHVHAATEWLVR